MSRIRPLERHEVHGEVAAEFDRQVAVHGRMTHMKRTLAHSWPALRALMEWYPLRDAVAAFLGERATHVFVHAISAETDCLICSTFFRRLLIDAGDDPDAPALDAREVLLVELGRRLAAAGHRVPESLHARLAAFFTSEQIVALTALGAMMIATNVVNNALEVELDEYLKPYAKGSPDPGAPRNDA